MDLRQATQQCRSGQELGAEVVTGLVDELLQAGVDEEKKADFLRALSDKGETPAELVAFVQALMPRALKPGTTGNWNGRPLFDCCGTGGGGLNLVNISTAMVFVLTAAGVPVVKHGNHGVTKASGSADVLDVLGIRRDLGPAAAQKVFEATGAIFFMAPVYHPSFANLVSVRKRLAAEGRRTVFNLLGPLLNPAIPDTQIIGVFKPEHTLLFSKAMRLLGRKRYLAVYGSGEDGTALGEFSIFGQNQFQGSPGLALPEAEAAASGSFRELLVSGKEESAERILLVLRGRERGLLKEMIVQNSALGLLVHGSVTDFAGGAVRAREMIESGAALATLERWRQLCQTVTS